MSKVYRIHVFNNETGEFDRVVNLYLTHSIGYVKCARSGNFIVSWTDRRQRKPRRQEIVVLPDFFYRIMPHASRNVVASCVDATPEQLTALGFVYRPATEEEVTADDPRVAIVS